MNSTTTFRNFAMTVTALAVLLVASLAFAPSAWANSSLMVSTMSFVDPGCAVIKSDGYLHQTDSDCEADYGVVWGQDENECRSALEDVTCLAIDPDVTSIATVKVKWIAGNSYGEQEITLSGNRGEKGTHNLETIIFAKSGEKSSLSRMGDYYQFYRLENLRTVVGFERTSLRTIPYGCFFKCSNLSDIKLPSCATTIGSAAFYDCDSLKRVLIPASVNTIGNATVSDGTFAECDSLKTIVLYSPNRVSIDYNTFNNANANLKFYVPNSAYSKYLEKTSSNRWVTDNLASKVHPFLEIASVGKGSYTGKAVKPAVTVNWIGSRLAASHYSVAYSNNVNAGTGKVVVTGDASHSGKVSKSFTIAKAKVAAPTAKRGLVYNGKAQTGVAAAKGYTVSGGKATNGGSYTAKATLSKNYQWSDGSTAKKSVAWKIKPASQTMTVKATSKSVKAKEVKKAKAVLSNVLTVSNAKGGVSYAKVSGSSKLSVDSSTGKVAVSKGTKKGTYTMKVKVTAKGNANYAAGSKTVTVTVKVK